MIERRFLLCAMAAVALVSCGKEPMAEVVPSDGGADVITALAEQPCGVENDSRTSIASDAKTVLWTEGDAISAFGAEGGSSVFTLTGGAGTPSAEFSGSFAGEAPYTLLYPHSEDAAVSDGTLSFKLPHEQIYKASTFAAGVNPAVATCTAGGNVQFRNLCGVLRVSVKGKGQQLKNIVLQDLAGNMLWGDASVKLDGKQGTDEQTFSLSGGDNTLSLEMGGITINAISEKVFYFIVPVGTLDRGFTLAFHTLKGEVYGFLQTQQPNTAVRSVVRTMPSATTSAYTEPADAKRRGYYKDLFMDSGIELTSRKTFYASDFLEWDIEYFASNADDALTDDDTGIQRQVICGSVEDINGVLLYPDNEPRFREIYVNGGSAAAHGKTIKPEGLENVRTFVSNGGSYVGSCAGAFISSQGSATFPNTNYFGVWPGRTYTAKTDGGVTLQKASLTLVAEPGCPLLNYFDFGQTVRGVYHNGGCYIVPGDAYWPEGTEILMRYYAPGPDSTNINGCVNAWAYKASPSTGRVVSSGSHPEKVSYGPQLSYMAAMLAYAADGSAAPDIKPIAIGGSAEGVLGDLQYHHYKFTVTDDRDVEIRLSGEDNIDLILSLRRDGLAWISDAPYVLASKGSTKTLKIKNLESGDWYIGVRCATAVTSKKTTYTKSGEYFKYTGRTDVLNGTNYTLKIL